MLATLLIGSQHQRYLAPNQGLRADDAEWAMTIDPGGGAEWMVDLEGWGSNLPVAGSGLDKLENRTHLGHLESLAGGLVQLDRNHFLN